MVGCCLSCARPTAHPAAANPHTARPLSHCPLYRTPVPVCRRPGAAACFAPTKRGAAAGFDAATAHLAQALEGALLLGLLPAHGACQRRVE